MRLPSSLPPVVSALADRRTRWTALAVSCLVHGLLLGGLLFLPRSMPSSEQPEPSARVRFVKAAPPRQRPLTRRVLSVPARRPLVRRQQVHAAPRQAQRPGPTAASAGSQPGSGGSGSGQGSGEGWGLGSGEDGGGFLGEGTGGLGQGLPAGTGLGLGGGGGIGPGLRAGPVGGQRAGADEIDLGLELLGVEALDTGRERAVVIVDPKDRRRLKGFLYLASVYSEAIERSELDHPQRSLPFSSGDLPSRQVSERRILQGLADRMTEQTQVRV
ncbi:MAG: hypothetical protein WDA75_22230, partial [Candidatus Latescibacterota bacterium]